MIANVDPMNMVRLSHDKILHKGSLILKKGQYVFKVENKNVVTEFSDSMWKINKIFLPLSLENIHEGEVLKYKSKTIEINWQVEKLIRNKDKTSITII